MASTSGDVADVQVHAVHRRLARQRERVHLDALGEQPLGQVAAVLAADAGDQGTRHGAQCGSAAGSVGAAGAEHGARACGTGS